MVANPYLRSPTPRSPVRPLVSRGLTVSAGMLQTEAQPPTPKGGGVATGTNTGDQTITLTGAVTGSGTGALATTLAPFAAPARLKSYTVATLPAGTQGDIAFVTDALAPTFLAAIVGGGAVVTPVFFNGSQWIGY